MKLKFHTIHCTIAVVSTLLLVLIAPQTSRSEETKTARKAVEAKHGMVVTVSPPATDVGVTILKESGNAVDASVATAFTLAVTWPGAGNIGGGGFMLVHPAGDKPEPVVIDYRETAPAAATKDMFKDEKSWYNHRVVGVPGTVRGLEVAHAKYGRLPWKDLVAPAIKLADDGFQIDEALADSLNNYLGATPKFAEFERVFGKPGGGKWKAGDRLVQKDLAWSLRQIADKGADAFYSGPIADKFVAEMKEGKGLITKQDLAGYKALVQTPIHGTYRGYDVYGPPPPSSGGTCLVEMLNILENFDLKKQGRFSPETIHIMAEAMRRAYCDRARHLGDPDFVKIPAKLTDKDYAKDLAREIDLKKATKSEDLAKDLRIATGEGDSTTHFSIVDKDGMAVANTYTLERSYGSRVVVRGAGFLLNNEMGDFNWRPGVTDREGGIGTDANLIAPGKRMLSSQSPTIIAREGKVVLITGSPGSRTIINTVLCIVINVIDFDMDICAAVDAPRMHHQWFPDELRLESGSEQDKAVEALKKMGHKVRESSQGDAHSIWVDPKTGTYYGAADKRIDGKAAGP
jgi:gamma-glutamyltranspeptidase / glutathione hydrolase